MTKGKPYDFWNKNAMTYEVESLEKKNDQLLKAKNKLYAENKRINLGNSAQNYYATKKLAIKKRNQVYKDNPNTEWIARWKI